MAVAAKWQKSRIVRQPTARVTPTLDLQLLHRPLASPVAANVPTTYAAASVGGGLAPVSATRLAAAAASETHVILRF